MEEEPKGSLAIFSVTLLYRVYFTNASVILPL